MREAAEDGTGCGTAETPQPAVSSVRRRRQSTAAPPGIGSTKAVPAETNGAAGVGGGARRTAAPRRAAVAVDSAAAAQPLRPRRGSKASGAPAAAPATAATDGVAMSRQRPLRPAPQRWLLYEHFLLCLACCSLAFFVASYQVHEKAVMLPLLPLSLLGHRLPLTAALFNLVGVWSMWPLLAKDGLLMPAAVFSAFHAAVAWPSAARVSGGDAAVYAAAVNWTLPPSWARVTALRLRPWLCVAAAALLAVMGALSAVAAVLQPPASLPDLHPYLSAVAGAGMLTALLAALTLVQLQLVFGAP
jgi:hypothetical protein